MRPRPTAADRLRALAVGQVPVLETIAQMQIQNLARSGLDEDTYRLVRLAALIALDPDPITYLAHLGSGESRIPDELVLGTLVAVAPLIGSARVLSAAARLVSSGLVASEPGPSATGRQVEAPRSADL
jgi:hypothetical protein